jgi:GT2 family glycosyltransferase
VGRWIEAAAVAAATARQGSKALQVGWVLGACLVTKKDVFDSLGGFDEDYFLYFEEVDYCRRVLRSGRKVGYFVGASVDHIGSVTGKRDYQAFTRRFYVGKALYMRKTFDGVQRRVMSALLRLQILAQIALSVLLYPVRPAKYGGKIAGSRQAIREVGRVFRHERRDAIEHAVSG